MISNCGSDENKKYSGGKAGDQTGAEWRIINWYNRPWKCVLRHPDPNVRKLISQMAKAAANNNNIGYDQGQRTTFWTQLQAVNYYPENIKVPCEADCSAGVAAICKAVGYRLNITALKNISIYIYTGNQRAALKAAGFEVLTDSKYLTSDAYLLEGDVLLNDSCHTAINVTDGSKAGAAPLTDNGNKGNDSHINKTIIKNVQTWINSYCGAGLVVDGDFGPKTKQGLCMALQKTLNDEFHKGLVVDGSFGPKTTSACVSASAHRNLTYIAQVMLYVKGYNMAHSIVNNNLDSSYGNGMKATVKAFQASKGLVQDGDCGPKTFYALFN